MKYALSRKWKKHLGCKIIYYFVRPLSSLRDTSPPRRSIAKPSIESLNIKCYMHRDFFS